MFIRSKVVKGATYYQAVEGYRDAAGRVRHRTLASLGQHPTVGEALKTTEAEVRRVRRATEKERDLWPESTPRPRQSAARLGALERRLTQLEERRRRLAALIGQRRSEPRSDRHRASFAPPAGVMSMGFGPGNRTAFVYPADLDGYYHAGVMDPHRPDGCFGYTRRPVPRDALEAQLEALGFLVTQGDWVQSTPSPGLVQMLFGDG